MCNLNCILGKLAPSLTKRFKIYSKSFFECIREQKTISEVLKTLHFSLSAFWLAGQWEGYCPPFHSLAMLLLQSVVCRVIIAFALFACYASTYRGNMSMGTKIVLLSSIALYDI